jgi:hypothetical protein
MISKIGYTTQPQRNISFGKKTPVEGLSPTAAGELVKAIEANQVSAKYLPISGECCEYKGILYTGKEDVADFKSDLARINKMEREECENKLNYRKTVLKAIGSNDYSKVKTFGPQRPFSEFVDEYFNNPVKGYRLMCIFKPNEKDDLEQLGSKTAEIEISSRETLKKDILFTTTGKIFESDKPESL